MHPGIQGVILSGGRSSRMGRPKALLAFGNVRLIDHVAGRLRPQVAALALNANDPAITLEGAERFADHYGDFPGPLAGIHASLSHARRVWPDTTHVALVPVDAPFFPADLVAGLADILTSPDEVALTRSCGRMHPVMGLWPVSAAGPLAAWLENPPTLKVRAFLDRLTVRVLDFPTITTPLGEVDPFFNINTPADLDHALKIAETLTRMTTP